MITREEARRYRRFIEQMSVNATDEEALDNIEAFPKWAVGMVFTKDDVNKARVRYNNVLYKVIGAHTSQADWTPDIAVSLYTRIDDPSIEFPEWRQPVGAEDAYPFGAKVSHNDKHWISTYEGANVWEPGVYGWDEIV